MLRMSLNFLDEEQSFVTVCNDKIDEKKYF